VLLPFFVGNETTCAATTFKLFKTDFSYQV